jgi:hypothetical protein
MAIFTDASGDVKILATEIIDRYHSHLIEARIGYFYRCGPWRSRKRIVHARAQKPSGLLYAVTGYDFIITINYETWSNMRQETKDALLDHELQHCCRGEDDDDGNPVWYIQGHDFEDFAAIVRRHGLYTDELAKIPEATQKYQQTKIPGLAVVK